MTHFISLRLKEQHKDPQKMEKLLEILLRQPGACDEIWFSSDYGFPELSVHQKHAKQMADAAALLRANGIAASLQLSNTVGHDDTQCALNHRGIQWQHMVGHDGAESVCANCPRDPAFHHYLWEYVKLYAAWKPDYVWVDDDLRMANHYPVSAGCFCTNCLEAFAKKSGRSLSREELIQTLDHGDPACRAAWVSFCRESLSLVTKTICEAVQEVAPDAIMGYEHGGFDWSNYLGGDHHEVFDVMKKYSRHAPASRPGAGYYIDHAPRDILYKAFSIHLQNTRLPSYVTDIRPEIENFTHTALGKSSYGTVMEATLDLALGCNHLSFATMMVEHEPLSWHEHLLEAMRLWRPYWERYLTDSKGATLSGVQIAYSRNQFQRKMNEDEPALAWASRVFQALPQMATMGLPLCFSKGAGNTVILHPDAADGMDLSELEALFSGNVMTDGETLSRLEKRGLNHLSGVTTVPLKRNSLYEIMSHHPLNGKFSDCQWIQYLYEGNSYELSSTGDAEILGHYIDGDEQLHGTATLLTKTPSGGRLAVFGYSLWSPIVCSAKKNQILEALDWISEKKIPLRLDDSVQMVLFPQCRADGSLQAVMLINDSIDASTISHLRFRRASGTAILIIHGQSDLVLPQKISGDELIVTLPPLKPWAIGYIVMRDTIKAK